MKSRLVVGGEGSVGMEGLHEPEEVGHRRPGLALALGGAMMPQTVRPHAWVGVCASGTHVLQHRLVLPPNVPRQVCPRHGLSVYL